MNELLEILRDIRPDVDFEKEKGLVSDGIFDSFDIVSLVTSIAENLDIQINPADLTPENFDSAEAIHELLCRIEED